jgi:phosphatidylglycerol lysyltransferase
VPVQQFSLSGNAVKHLRATMNRFAREGYHTALLEPPHSRAVLERLREVSDAWLARGNRRERTFTLGYFDESLVRDSVIMAAFAPEGTIVAFADIVPSYRSGEGNFDMLRYLAEPKDVADFLHVSLVQYFRDRGLTSMSLGLAPFSGLELAQLDSTAVHAMRLLYRYGTMLFRYQGLREYKEKFHPVWEPRYLVYTTELQLPGIALAVGRAGELPRRRRLELPRLRRHEQEPLAA